MSDDYPELSTRALCTLEELKQYLPSFTGTDVDDDELLIRLINSESDDFLAHTQREIKPEDAAPAPRVFDVDEDVVEWRELPIGEAASIDTVAIADANGVAVDAAPSYVALPRNRKSWEPITELWFRPDVTTSAQLARGYVVTVTAVWGWPAVPERVRDAVIALTAAAYISDAAREQSLEEIDPDLAAAFRRNVRKALDTRRQLRTPVVG